MSEAIQKVHHEEQKLIQQAYRRLLTAIKGPMDRCKGA